MSDIQENVSHPWPPCTCSSNEILIVWLLADKAWGKQRLTDLQRQQASLLPVVCEDIFEPLMRPQERLLCIHNAQQHPAALPCC